MSYLKMNRAADSGLFVVESLRTYKDVVHDSLAAKWKAKRPEEEPPRVDLVIDFMAEDLSDSRVAMVSGLERFLNETSGDKVDRKEREDSVQDLRFWYRYFRDHCLNTYGEEETLAMGFALVTEEHPWRLARQAERAINFFQDHDPDEQIAPKDPRKAEGALRAGWVVEVLRPLHGRLVGVLEALLSESRNEEKAFLHKERLHEVFVDKFTVYAKCSEMLYRWAGLDEEAKRIKPSARRPGQREEVAEEPDPEAEADGPRSSDAPEEAVTE